MKNITVLVFFVTIVIAPHGLAIGNFSTTDAIGTETQVDGSEEIINSLYKENIRSRYIHVNKRHKHAKFTEFIMNGKAARIGQFPFQVTVSLKEDMTFVSAGAIISNYYVLTVAFWICKSHGEKNIIPQELVVNAGMVNLHANDSISYAVQDTTCHAQYAWPKNDVHEIALVQTTKPFEFSTAVQRIKLPTQNYGGGLSVTISGWGSTTSTAGSPNEHLMYGDTFTLSYDDCKEMTRDDTDTFLSPVTGCTYGYNTSEGSYAGLRDEGALVVHRQILIGVVARRYPRANMEGYVSVWHHLDWIKRQVVELD